MSASGFRSHFRSQAQKDTTSSQRPPTQSSRIPTKPSSSSNDDNKQTKATQHVSKLAKRTSKSIASTEKTEYGAKSTTTQAPVPITTARGQPEIHVNPTATQSQIAPASIPHPSIARNHSLFPRPTIQTPSLVFGSSASTLNSPRTIGLRRKPSTIEQYAAAKRSQTPKIAESSVTARKEEDEFSSACDQSVLGIPLPQATTGTAIGDIATQSSAPLPQNVFHPGQPVTRDITPPVPNYAQTATPSTRYTDSPFSHVPTPSSASSYSPGVAVTSNAPPSRVRQQSPTRSRPPVTGRLVTKGDGERLGLPPVRESSTSSSNSTVKPGESRWPLSKREVPPKPASAPPVKTSSNQSQAPARGKRIPAKSTAPPSQPEAPVQIPPELAHLNVEPPQKLALNKPYPPLRPSRDGTPNLAGMNVPSPVVQSDLPRLYTTYHKRTPSQETPTSATSPSFKTRFGLSPKASSKQSSPRIDSAISPPPGARAFARGPTPEEQPTQLSKVSRKDSPAVGPSPSKSPRFGFFSRKPKADNTKPIQKPKREPSKGPVAGTGHEGYGRFSMRSRTGSVSSNTGVRSPSMETTASSQKKRQSTSNKGSVSSRDGSDLDDFLRERMKPVILRGSGSTFDNTVSSADSQAPSVPNSSKNSSLDSFPKPSLLPSAMDSQAGVSPAKQTNSSRRAPSDSSEDDVSTRYPAFTAAKSLTQTSQLDWTPAGRVPSPLNSNGPSKDSSYDSYDAETSQWPQTDSTMPHEDPFEGKEGLWLRSGKVEAENKTPRKWNFFQRAHASPRDKGKAKEAVAVENPVSPSHQSPNRGGVHAHYAILDPAEPVGLDEVERMLQENETSAEESMSESNPVPRMVPYESRHRSLLPYPPKPELSNAFDVKAGPKPPRILIRPDSEDSTELMNAERTIPHQAPHMVEIQRSPSQKSPSVAIQSDPWAEQKAMMSDLKSEVSMSLEVVQTPDMPQAPFNTPENPDQDSPARQPRLSPVGRIPKVVSKRDRERKLSDSSFSRPFVRDHPKPTVKPPGSLYTEIRELASPIESGSQPVSSTSTNSQGIYGEQEDTVDTIVPLESNYRESTDLYGSDFFAYPSRKDSEISYSSSSGYTSVRAALAYLPQSDDIWNEFDDWLDAIVPGRTSSKGPSLGAPFRYQSRDISPLETFSPAPPRSELPPLPGYQPVRPLPNVPHQLDAVQKPSITSLRAPQPIPENVDDDDNRSVSALPTTNKTMAPTMKSSGLAQTRRSSTSTPTRGNISGANRTSIPGPNRSSLPRNSRSSLPVSNRSSVPRSDRSSVHGSVTSSARHSRSSGHSRSASLPEANVRNSQASLTPSARFNRDTQLLDIAEIDGDEQAALANLRFGALMTSKWLSFGRVLFSPAHNEMRLADDPKILIIDGLGSDWSYYVALSYPAATVYNLGPTAPNGMSDWPGVNQKPPSNHRHINHAAISAAFPFPKGFFTAVVFRFPLITTDQAYQACVCECKRVLRPGGYLEVTALDLDLMNMGSKARREIRGLKTRMQQCDRNISLRNLSDVLVRLVGRRGFEEVQRCFVGVPAAGRIPRSQDMSSASSDGSGNKPAWPHEDRDSQEFSFADLLEDARATQTGESRGNDENITKMVAKVGRWWYSTCYEKAMLGTANNSSIWHDATLLRECEKQGTSFRLLICYAQKPAQTTRRTVSV